MSHVLRLISCVLLVDLAAATPPAESYSKGGTHRAGNFFTEDGGVICSEEHPPVDTYEGCAEASAAFVQSLGGRGSGWVNFQDNMNQMWNPGHACGCIAGLDWHWNNPNNIRFGFNTPGAFYWATPADYCVPSALIGTQYEYMYANPPWSSRVCWVERPPTAAPTTAPTTSALGDAHLFGPHGDRTDFKGRNNTYYNVLSTNNVSANVLFVHEAYNWRSKVVFGSWMKAVAVTAMTAENKLVKAAYHCERPAMMDVFFEGENELNGPVNLGSDLIFEQVEVSLSKDYVFAVSNGEWEVEAKNSYLPYKSKNAQKKRLDVSLKTIANVDLNPVAPHGLIGQAWDRDDKMVIGALDDYQKQGRVVETSAMAEGAIEGSAVDYEIDPLDRFSTKFKYSRFGLKRAAPRDVSLLSGKKLFALKTTASAGAMNDEDSEA